MDVARHRVFADGRDVTLTHMEFELLRYLLINRGIALTRERLLDAVWGVDYPGDTRTVDVHMRTLRVKLGQASRYLQTVRGVGYGWRTWMQKRIFRGALLLTLATALVIGLLSAAVYYHRSGEQLESQLWQELVAFHFVEQSADRWLRKRQPQGS